MQGVIIIQSLYIHCLLEKVSATWNKVIWLLYPVPGHISARELKLRRQKARLILLPSLVISCKSPWDLRNRFQHDFGMNYMFWFIFFPTVSPVIFNSGWWQMPINFLLCFSFQLYDIMCMLLCLKLYLYCCHIARIHS